ncbi:MAG: SMP-30/gluconolactonase/LRE family protein [Candidatus Marinimicrobia bacterium]|nr:SMP-30/gluconolactonase/LRE family protein [Candidatus Neomarinimicrobiota bacterium]
MKRLLFFLLLILSLLLITSCSNNKFFTGDFKVVAEDLNFPEGPSLYDGQLVFSNCYGSWIASVSNGILDTLLNSSDGLVNTNGTAFDKHGNLYICEYGKGSILRLSAEGELQTLVDKDYNGIRFNRPNDIAVSQAGMIYFTDPKSYDTKVYDGRLFRTDPNTGKTTWLIEGLQFPNGLCFSPDGKTLYIGESVNKNILQISHGVGILDTLITLPGGNQDPDGMDVDVEGNLYIAYFGGGKIFVVSPEGKLLASLDTPGKKPSNLEFGGEDMKTLYISECETNKIYSIRTVNAGHRKL